MCSRFSHRLIELGEILEMGANQPFRLDGSDSFWMVDRGSIDVFSVITKDGQPVGRRTRLCRIHSGELIFPLTQTNGEADFCFLGVPGPATRVIKTNLTHIDGIQKDTDLAPDLAGSVDTWVSVLSAALSAGGPTPKFSQDIREGDALHLEPSQTVRSGTRVAWVLQASGSSRFMGQDELSIIDQGRYLPLSHNTWLEAIENTQLQAFALSDLLSRGIPLRQCLAQFHEAICQFVRLEQRQSAGRDKARLLSSIDQDRQVTQRALGHLSAILGEKDVGLEATTTDPLFNACQIIGEALGITIQRPAPTARPLDLDDALRRISGAFGFRIREVKLKGTWWNQDHGPLLALRTDSGLPVALLPDRMGRYQLHDPSADTKVPVDASTSQTLDTRAFVVYTPFPEGKLTPWSMFTMALSGCRKDITLIILLAVGSGAPGYINSHSHRGTI